MKTLIILTFEGNPIAADLFSSLEKQYSVHILYTPNNNLSLTQLWKKKRGFRWLLYNSLFSLYAKRYKVGHTPKPSWDELKIKYKNRFRLVKKHNSILSQKIIKEINSDLGVLIGTEIIKPEIFKLPKKGMINLHQGNIPKYRGAPPGFWEHFNREKEMFVSVHKVVSKLDAGDLLVEKKFSIEEFKHYTISKFYANQLSTKQLKRGIEMVFNDSQPEKRTIEGKPNTVPEIRILLYETYKLLFWRL